MSNVDQGGGPAGDTGSGTFIAVLRALLTNVSKLVQLQRIVNTLPYGGVLAVNNVGTAFAQVIPADQSRTALVFHNPSLTTSVMVAPMVDKNGAALAPTFAAPAGGMLILPTDYLPISGNCQAAHGAVAQIASSPLTIITSTF